MSAAPTRDGCVRVALCEPVAALRDELYAMLHDAPGEPCIDVVGEASDGEQGVQMVGDVQPDVAVVELWLPKLDGLQAIPQMRSAASDTRIIVYSTASSRNVKQLCETLGADAFVDKAGPTEVLVGCVRELAA